MIWPALDYAATQDTLQTLQLWTQIVGKIRLARTPWLNHSWHVPLYVSARGLTTGPIPFGNEIVDIAFEFAAAEQRLTIAVSTGEGATIPLLPMSVAAFHERVLGSLRGLGLPISIDPMPCEIADALPFDRDTVPRAYDPATAHSFWRALIVADGLLKRFRTGFLGKASPVHFFWGSFDLAVTRFSGRGAPLHPGGVPHLSDAVAREAYSHEVSSAGFWPGNVAYPHAAFYSYAYPKPDRFERADMGPGAGWLPDLGEWVLPWDVARAAPDPAATVSAFLQSTYAAAADLGRWDRSALECGIGKPDVPRAI